MTTAIRDILGSAPEFSPEPPRPLRRELPPPEPFPADALGDTLGAAALAIHARIQAPVAICAQSTLAAATLAVQAHADVMLPFGQLRPLSGYYLTVAESGERKSSADSEALAPVRAREAELREADADARTAYEAARSAWTVARKRIEGDRELDRAGIERALADLGAEPTGPLAPMLTAPEPTLEGLVRLFATGWPSLGLFSSEGGQFVGGYGMSSDHRVKTAAALAELWAGEPVRRVRAGDGAYVLPGRRLAMHLMVQPGVASGLLADATLADQGLLARLLTVAPQTTAGTRLWREPDAADANALARYCRHMLATLREPLPLRSGTHNELEPRVLPLDPPARAMWIKLADHVERQLAPGGALEGVRAFASKVPEHAARLGAVLQLVDRLDAPHLDASHLAAGIELAEHYLAEAVRLHEAAATRPEIVAAERLLAWLHATWTLPLVGLPEVYMRGPNGLREARRAREIVGILEEHGHLVRVDGGADVGGTFRREAWRIVRPA